ncbi:acyl-CoA dehydrogenase family protein [Micromonospora sediminicola]|uniref:acyl-CoA dehydrogenase family protein n=1 Tax=Micromonospora sediminicola TaxID=946078 RepID=UPI0033EE2467
MTSIISANPQGHHAPPGSGVGPAEVIRRAEEMVPLLIEQQAATEERTFYSDEIHEEFRKAGFYRILVPRRYGGLELDIETFFRVSMALARGCPSTGWMYCLAAAHAIPVATLFDERAQEEIFRGGEFFCPGTVVPAGTARRDEQGWRLDGTWAYCSGAPYATHLLGHTLVSRAEGQEPEPMMFLAPRDRWKRLHDWGSLLGLRGSGSHSITMDNAYIPDHLTLPTHLGMVEVTDEAPGLRLHGNPMYGSGQLSFMVFESACVAVGMAQGALDCYEDLMRSRMTTFPPITPRTENPDYQFWYGQAAGLIATAEAAIFSAIQQWMRTGAGGPSAFTKEFEWRIAGVCREVIGMCWQAVESYLFPTAGSSAIRQGTRLERIWRDMSMMRTHAGIANLLAATANRELARARFGVEQHELDTL